MLDASSLGRAQPRQKSINVEANILGEWLTQRIRLQAQVRRWTLAAMVIAVSGGVSVPILYQMQAGARARLIKASAMVRGQERAIERAESDRSSAEPVIRQRQMLERSQSNLIQFTGQLLFVLNATPPSVAISNVKIESLGGELTIRCRADAEDATAARRFVEEASKGPEVVSSLQAAMHRSDLLGPSSVSFDFIKRVKVAQ